MRIPVQLGLQFPTQQKRRAANERGVPIDEFFPEEEANKVGEMEAFNKHLYRPNTYLHKWWARRSGTTFRHILKQLVRDYEKRDFYEPGGLDGKIILDPMMGGGTILHEAIRMGANVIGVDIDPIPVLQNKATLNWISVDHKVKTFNALFATLLDELGELYQTTCPQCANEAWMQFTLYGLVRNCKCGEFPFVDSLVLREESDGSTLRLCPVCGEVFNTGQEAHCSSPAAKQVIFEREQSRCSKCGDTFREDVNKPYCDRYRPLVMVGFCQKHGQFFKSVDKRDEDILRKAKELSQRSRLGGVRRFRVPSGPKSDDLLRRKITSFLDVFTPRQLLYIEAAAHTIAALPAKDRLWLSLLISTSLEFNSLLCGYKGVAKNRPGAIRHVFSHHAYSFPYTALENNPVCMEKSSGTIQRLFCDRIVRGGEWAASPTERQIIGKRAVEVRIHGEVDGGKAVNSYEQLREGARRFYVFQADSARLPLPDDSVDFVVTDPPYYDSVQYSDLSNFFRVWLRLLLPKKANWNYDQQAAAVFEGEGAKEEKYADKLGLIWKECARVLRKKNGRLIFTFHHWRAQAWAELTVSLKRGGFVLVNRYVVFSENPISVHIRQLNALKHDAILVLKPALPKTNTRKWDQPSAVNAGDSYGFSQDCAAALGWFLEADLAEQEIVAKWESLLGD
jgi:putative DNA methylase